MSSGASQALMALCGAAVLMLSRGPRIFACTIVLIQAALDLYVAQYVKVGHSSGFVAGLALGGLLLFAGARASGSGKAADRG